MFPWNIPFENRIPFAEEYVAVDTFIMAQLTYTGPKASGVIDIANTTGDITFKHGAAGAEAADTDPVLNSGGTGVIDVSARAATWIALQRIVNSSQRWHLALKGVLPTDATEASGTAKYLNNLTGQSCNSQIGYSFLNDNSASLHESIGMTLDGKVTKIHGTDHGVVHVVERVICQITFAGGTPTIKAYACDDDDGTSSVLKTWAPGTTGSLVAYPSEANPTSPQVWAKGKRLVLQVANSVDMTAPRIALHGWSYPYGPSFRKHKMWSAY